MIGNYCLYFTRTHRLFNAFASATARTHIFRFLWCNDFHSDWLILSLNLYCEIASPPDDWRTALPSSHHPFQIQADIWFFFFASKFACADKRQWWVSSFFLIFFVCTIFHINYFVAILRLSFCGLVRSYSRWGCSCAIFFFTLCSPHLLCLIKRNGIAIFRSIDMSTPDENRRRPWWWWETLRYHLSLWSDASQIYSTLCVFFRLEF